MMINKVLERAKELKGKLESADKLSGKELFDKYLSSIKDDFSKELYKNMRDGYTGDDKVYDLCVNVEFNYKVSKIGGKLYIQFCLTDILDYHLMASTTVVSSSHGEELAGESMGEMIYLGKLNDFQAKYNTIKISLDDFYYELRKNGFNYGMDIEPENLELIPEGKFIGGLLNVSKNYINIPQKTAIEKARKRLTLSKIYSENKKWF